MRQLLVPRALTLSVALGGCGSEPPRTTAAESAASAPAAVDRSAEEQAIRTLGKGHAQAVASKDTAGVGDIYADDVVYLPQDDAAEEGLAAARGAWMRGLSVPGVRLQYVPVAIEVAAGGDMAYERGTMKAALNDKPLPPGNYLYVWRKRDGQWRVAAWIWNAQPPGGRP